jgi:hypothetical protein
LEETLLSSRYLEETLLSSRIPPGSLQMPTIRPLTDDGLEFLVGGHRRFSSLFCAAPAPAQRLRSAKERAASQPEK